MNQLILEADVTGIREALSKDPSQANKGLPYDEKNQALAHPLHRIADGVFAHKYSDEKAVEIAAIFLEFGADISGVTMKGAKDTPLIAAASLGAEKLGLFYLSKGANIHHRGTHGGTALHWAAWTGYEKLVEQLIKSGSDIHQRCVEYHSTPLMWAVNGYGFENGIARRNQIACAKLIIAAGGNKTTNDDDRKKMGEFLPTDDVDMKAVIS